MCVHVSGRGVCVRCVRIHTASCCAPIEVHYIMNIHKLTTSVLCFATIADNM